MNMRFSEQYWEKSTFAFHIDGQGTESANMMCVMIYIKENGYRRLMIDFNILLLQCKTFPRLEQEKKIKSLFVYNL